MRILFECRTITPTRSCGIEGFTYSLIRGLAKLAPNQITILCNIPAWAEKDYQKILKTAEIANIKLLVNPQQKQLFRYNKNNLSRLIFYPFRLLSKKLDEIYKGTEINWIRHTEKLCDVVIYPYHHDEILHEKVSSLMVLHDFYDFENDTPLNLRRRKIIEKNIRQAMAITCSWPAPFIQLTDRFGSLNKQLEMIPFLMDYPVYNNASKPFNTASDKFQFLYASSTAKHKNHINLVKALGIFKRKYSIKIVIVCTGRVYKETWKEISQEIKKQQVEEEIKFLGFIDRERVHHLYETSHAVIASTKYEAFSGTVLEGFQAGLPVACSNIEALSSFIDNYLNIKVSYFNPESPEDIARAMFQLIENFSFYRQQSMIAKEKVMKITPESTANAYYNILNKIQVV